MNNKKGGFGAKLLLVLILMIASAVGGAYGYRVLDGKLAVRDAMKAVEDVDISDYDTEEQSVIQGYIDDAKRNLETAKTRKEVYEVIGEFATSVEKVQTANEKKLEQALREAEEAKQRYGTNNQTTDQSGNYSNDTNDTSNTTNDDNGYTGDNLTTPSTDDEESSGGFLNSLIGGLANGDN